MVTPKAHDTLFWVVIVVAILGLVWAVWQSKRESESMKQAEQTLTAKAATN